MTDALSHPFARGFAVIMANLRAAIFYVAGKPALNEQPYMHARRPLALPLALRLQRRLGKMIQQFDAVFAYVVAFGEDPPQRAPRRKSAPRPEAGAAQASDAAPGNLPHGVQSTAPGARPDSPKRAPRPAPARPGRLAALAQLRDRLLRRAVAVPGEPAGLAGHAARLADAGAPDPAAVPDAGGGDSRRGRPAAPAQTAAPAACATRAASAQAPLEPAAPGRSAFHPAHGQADSRKLIRGGGSRASVLL